MPSILITGANRGLGFEFARQYGADGWRVFATCRNPKSATALQELANPGVVKIIPLDVTDQKSIRAASSQIKDDALDLLVNCAGIAGPPDQRTGNVDYESWKKVLDVNVMGPLRVTEAFINNLALGERKMVVTITSGMGSITDNTSGSSIPYRSSKAAVNMVMRTVAIDLAPSRHQFRGHQSGLGQNRYGRSKCAIDSNGERKCDETSDRDPRTGPNRQVFQSRWSRISLVRSNSQQCWRD